MKAFCANITVFESQQFFSEFYDYHLALILKNKLFINALRVYPNKSMIFNCLSNFNVSISYVAW